MEAVVTTAVFLLVCGIVASDALLFGFDSDVNGRLLSFLDSYVHCAAWVRVLPAWEASRERVGGWDRALAERVVGSAITKHASGILVSLLLGATPTVLQGWMHNASFAFALVLANGFPAASRAARVGKWRFVLALASALYKLRKLNFALKDVETPELATLLGILTVELTGWFVLGVRGTFEGPKGQRWHRDLLQPRLALTLLATSISFRHPEHYAPICFVLLFAHRWIGGPSTHGKLKQHEDEESRVRVAGLASLSEPAGESASEAGVEVAE